MADQSRVLTLVFTDLADSTALKTERGDRVVHDMIEAHRAHVTRLAQECSGRVIDWAGDGCFLTFETSSAATLFALRLQHVHADDPELPDVRIGIHMGEVTEGPGPQGPDGPPRIDGLAVDIAARISGLAKPGQVLMSAAVYNSARQRLGVEAFGQPILWQAHGTYELKGFDEHLIIGEAGVEGVAPLEAPKVGDKAKLIKKAPRVSGRPRSSAPAPQGRSPLLLAMGALVLVLAGALIFVLGRQSGSDPESQSPAASTSPDAPGQITSIAVLPLDNLMNDPAQDYFSDGMTEAITAELSKIKSLTVRGRTSAMRYKDSDKTIPEIAAELNVDGLIEGSVLRDGEDIRITVQLVHASDTHVWSESYTETVTSVLKLQSDVALAIADAINAEITGEERTRIASAHTVDPEAHEAYLLGEHFRHEVTEEGLSTAVEYFDEAIRIDPDFAEAWSELGDVYRIMHGWGYGSAREIIPKSRAAFQRALELDPDLAKAHSGLAWISFANDREWEQAEGRFKHALELSPNRALGHTDYAWYLRVVGRLDEAMRHSSVALDLDPGDPEVVRDAASVFGDAGQPERQRRAMEEILASHPDNIPAIESLVGAFWSLDMFPEAIAQAERAAELTERSSSSLLRLANSFALAGRTEQAENVLKEVSQLDDYVDAADLGRVYVTLGKFDEAFESFERGYEQRDWVLSWLKTFAYRPYSIDHPNHITFRTDPRFWKLVKRVGFPPFPPAHPGYADEQAWLARKAAAAEANAPIERIAVLPFDNLMRDPEQEFFVDGMTEALISELNQIEALQVRGRTTSMRYKDTDKTLEEIARELDVQGIIEGSVLREDDTVRITARLIHAPSGTSRWDGSYTNTVTSVLKLHSEMALSIAREVQVNLTPQERALVAEAKDVNAAAYEAYLLGEFFMHKQSEEGYNTAAQYYRQALELDPDYADAWAGLSGALWGPSIWGWADPREHIDEAKQAVAKALELDPASSQAQEMRGWISLGYDYDRPEARRQFQYSMELGSEDFGPHFGLAYLLALQGRHDEAVVEARIALDLDPFNPDARDALGDVYSIANRHEDAIAWRERTLELESDHEGTLSDLVWNYSAAERHEEALATYEKLVAATGKEEPARKAALLARAGREEEARAILAVVESSEFQDYAPAMHIAATYVAFGELDTALAWLDAAFEHRPWGLVNLTTWATPFFEPLHDDPRYLELVRRLDLEDTLEPADAQ